MQTNLATVICQRTNCVYDFSIRRLYNVGLGCLAGITFLTLFIISTAEGWAVKKLLIDTLAPSLPIFVLAIRQYYLNSDAITNLRSLKTLIEATLGSVRIISIVDTNVIRQIQDKIYNNRILSPLLPDWVFRKFRNQLESQMHFGVKDIIRDIQSR